MGVLDSQLLACSRLYADSGDEAKKNGRAKGISYHLKCSSFLSYQLILTDIILRYQLKLFLS